MSRLFCTTNRMILCTLFYKILHTLHCSRNNLHKPDSQNSLQNSQNKTYIQYCIPLSIRQNNFRRIRYCNNHGRIGSCLNKYLNIQYRIHLYNSKHMRYDNYQCIRCIQNIHRRSFRCIHHCIRLNSPSGSVHYMDMMTFLTLLPTPS